MPMPVVGLPPSPPRGDSQTSFLSCLEEATGGKKAAAIGIYNERSWGSADYVMSLRASLDAAGFASTAIVLADDAGFDRALMAETAANASFSAAWQVYGVHYPCFANASTAYPLPNADSLGKKFWASEDWWAQPNWDGASYWGRILNQRYIRANMTAVIAWSPLWSVYTNLLFQEAGLMRAREPWSGAYDITPGVWTTAQWTQFTSPGDIFLSVASGSSGFLPGGGSYAALVGGPADPGRFTLVLETMNAPGRGATDRPATAPQTVTFVLAGGLPAPGTALAAWATNASAQFVRLADAVVAPDGSVTVALGVEAMLTLSTVMSARKGAPAAPIPPPAPVPRPYADDFAAGAYDAPGRYWADQFGSFALRNGTLAQVAVLNPGRNDWTPDADPATILGDVNWTDVGVSVRATWSREQPLHVGRRERLWQ